MQNHRFLFLSNLINFYTMIRYKKKRAPVIQYIIKIFQFICIYLFKTSQYSETLNKMVHQSSNALTQSLVDLKLVVFLNMFVLITFSSLVIFTFIYKKIDQKAQISTSKLYQANFRNLNINLLIILELFGVPCIIVNIRLISYGLTDLASILSEILMISGAISLIIICLTIIVNQQAMLLKRWTIPISICCGIFKENLFLKIISLTCLLFSCSFKDLFQRSKQVFSTILKGLLLLIFLLHAFVPSISLIFFAIFHILIILLPLSQLKSEQNYTNIQINDFLIMIIQKLKDKKMIPIEDKIKVIKFFYNYQEEYKKNQESRTKIKIKSQLKLSNPLTYENLCIFFRAKICEDMKNNKKNNIYVLQYYLFEVSNNNLTLKFLAEVASFTLQFKETLDFEPKIRLMEVQHEIKKVFEKQKEKLNLQKIIQSSNMIECADNSILQVINQLTILWKKIYRAELQERQVKTILNKVNQKQEYIRYLIQSLQNYPEHNIKVRLYKYAMQLFNFDLQPTNSQKTHYSHIPTTDTLYMIQKEDIVVNASNQIMNELCMKKTQILSNSIQNIIPRQLIEFVNNKFSQSFLKEQKQKFILPFIGRSKIITAFSVMMDVYFDLNQGLQKIFYFYKNQHLKQIPCFLYCQKSHQILFGSKCFWLLINNNGISYNKQKIVQNQFKYQISCSLASCSKLKDQKIICHLSRKQKNEDEIEFNLKIIEIYNKDKKQQLILLGIERNEMISQLNSSTVFSLDNFIHSKDLEFQQSIKEKRAIAQDQTYCCIPNPYEKQIEERMHKIKSSFRYSYPSLICLFMLIILIFLITTMIYLSMTPKSLGIQTMQLIRQQQEKDNQIIDIYSLFYQYYQYYQIVSFPKQIEIIGSFDMVALNNEYRQKILKNIMHLVRSRLNEIIQTNHTYVLEYNNFNITKNTSGITIIDYLSDLNQALTSLNPRFSVINEHNINKLISAYTLINMSPLDLQIEIVQIISGVLLTVIISTAFIIKYLSFKINYICQKFLDIWENFPEQNIQFLIKKYQQLLKVIQKVQENNSNKQNKDLNNKVLLQPPQNHKLLNLRIKREIFFTRLISNNILIYLCVLLISIHFWETSVLSSHNNNVKAVIQKKQSLFRQTIDIIRPAEKFFQAAMEEIILPTQRKSQQTSSIEVITSSLNQPLSDHFTSFQKYQRSIRNGNLCDYAYLNRGYLYKDINCSLILNGIMNYGISQTYFQYIDLVRNYTGIGISTLGDVYRQGSTYPVYMEICYIRTTLNNIIKEVKKNFQLNVISFVEEQTQTAINIVYIVVCIIPILSIVMLLQLRRIKSQCRAVVKSFKLIPKAYLIKMKTSKWLKAEGILDKLEMIAC